MNADSPVRDVSDDTFERDVLEASREVPVVVDFWAPWCGPCKQLGPTLEELAEEAEGDWILAKLNVDDNKETSGEYDVRGIPAVKAFVDGEVVDEFTGVKSRGGVREWLDGFQRHSEAAGALEAGDLDRAESLYESILEDRPEDIEALAGRARVAVERSEFDEAEEFLDRVPEGAEDRAPETFARAWVALRAARADDPDRLGERIDSDPDDLEARFELGIQFADDGDYERALEQFLEIVDRDRDFGDDLGRRSMVRTFELIGPGTEQVREWRQKMGRAMY